jgi:hypothetical protein
LAHRGLDNGEYLTFEDYEPLFYIERWWANCPSVAPEYHVYNLNLGNENEDNGNDVEDHFRTVAGCGNSGADYYLDFGNL